MCVCVCVCVCFGRGGLGKEWNGRSILPRHHPLFNCLWCVRRCPYYAVAQQNLYDHLIGVNYTSTRYYAELATAPSTVDAAASQFVSVRREEKEGGGGVSQSMWVREVLLSSLSHARSLSLSHSHIYPSSSFSLAGGPEP